MSNVARIGDIVVGTCCCHSDPPCIGWVGIIVSGASTVYAEKSNVARIGDTTTGCGIGTIVTGASTVYAE